MMAALTRTTRKRALSLAKETSTASVATIKTKTTTVTTATTITKTTKTAATAKSQPPSPPTSSSSAAVPKPRKELHPPPFVHSTPWVSIQVSRSELDLTTTLKCGQSFRWQREHQELPSGEISAPTWSCVLDRRIWFIQETDDGFRFRTVRPSSSSSFSSSSSSPSSTPTSTTAKSSSAPAAVTWRAIGKEEEEELEKVDRAFLRDYFQLDVPLTELYTKWSATDKNFKAKAPFFPGVRMLRQDPVENLFCFICSSNNNISRITQMAAKMCSEYGSPLTLPPAAIDPLDSTTASTTSRTFYEFPTIDALAQDGVEETLRNLGFGYRAKYIARTARMIQEMEDGEAWLHGLRKLPYEDAHTALLTLQGVGPKVADCVCLMSLDKHETIPVDTHVWQIAVRDYRFRFEGKAPKAISPAIYKAVGRHFVDLFGGYAGWAHSVLFAADLRTIEGRVKDDPDVVKVEVLEEDERVVLKVEMKEEELVVVKQEAEEETVVAERIEDIKLEDPLEEVSKGRRVSKRRKAV